MRSRQIESGVTDIGEHAPIVTVRETDGALWVEQLHALPNGGIKASIVGMSRRQALEVRDALSWLLSPEK